MTAFPRGSEWGRWDLHVHSPLSILNNQFQRLPGGEPDWEKYIEAIQAKPVSVYGITDYFTIEGYKELKARQAKGALPGVRLLPNIEFRLDKLIFTKPGNQGPKRLNFHVIFSDEVPVEHIEEHFLHDLKFVYQENPSDAKYRMTLKPSNLIELGTKLIKDHPNFADLPPLQVGAMHAVVSLEAIQKRLKEEIRFANKYLLVLPADGWDELSWEGQDHLIRKLLLQATDFVFASNPKTISWCLAQSPYQEGEDKYREEFLSLKPCIHGSDAHSLTEIAHPCTKRSQAGHDCSTGADCELRNCWIKADPTFEGLRQVLYEPADRVKVQASDPTPSKTQFCISAVDLEDTKANQELHLRETHLPLNAGLVAVTGGRGSGKTALVDLLAHCFQDRVNSTDKNSFVRRVGDEGVEFGTLLTFLNGDTFSKTLRSGSFVENSNIVYIAQGELERYIGEGSDLNDYIHSLIFDSDGIRNSTDVYEYEGIARNVSEAQETLTALNGQVASLEQKTASRVMSALERDGKQAKAELEDLKKRVQASETKLTSEKVAAAKARHETLNELKAKRTQMTAAQTAVHNALRFIGTGLVEFQGLIRQVNAAIAPLGLGDPLALPEYADSTRLTSLQDEIGRQARLIVADIERIEKDLRLLEADQKEHATLLRKQQEAEAKYVGFKAQWKTLSDLKATLVTKQGERSAALRSLYQLVLEQRSKYDEIIQTFSEAKDAVLQDLDFEAEISTDRKTLLRDSAALLDNRLAGVVGEDGTTSLFEVIFEHLKNLPITGDAGLDAIVAETDRLAADLRDKQKPSFLETPGHLYQMLYRSYLTVHPVVRYKRVALDRLSMGQKATVLMKIYLAEGDSPIIIDSHDDHLDNESIMDELVGSIRQAKTLRQVILASNNGNVVVNSDAEQVIIAKRENGEITYIAGSLEDPTIRKRALEVLEGGERAFQRRQEKYRLHR